MSNPSIKRIKDLPIYPEKTAVASHNEVDITAQSQSFGVATMSLVSETKEFYRDTLKNIQLFKDYATSTEGKIKFSLIFVGLSSGLYLSYRSPSKSRVYKRYIIPTATTTLAASACFPYTAWAVAKKFYCGSVVVYHGTKKTLSYGYHQWQKFKTDTSKPDVQKAEIVETVYTTDESGKLRVTKELVSPSPPDSGKMQTATVQKTSSKPTSNKHVTSHENLPGDFGQSSPEDSDLYTTRS